MENPLRRCPDQQPEIADVAAKFEIVFARTSELGGLGRAVGGLEADSL